MFPRLLIILIAITPALGRAGEPEKKYEERGADGKLTLSSYLLEGKLHGEATYYENGKIVRKMMFDKGVAQHKPSLEELRKTLARITEATEDEHEAALRTLKAYRYLARIPYEDIKLDRDYTAQAEAATKICKELGRLEHHPKNPGWPEKDFALAKRGAGSSNLGQGFRKLAPAVHAWMDDSDKFNIDRLGHRRWCINPSMQKTGFGRTDEFTAMYTFDMSRAKTPPYEYVAFPPPGYIPAGYFRKHYAWSISFNPAKYTVPKEGVEVSVFPLDAKGQKQEALKLNYFNVDLLPFGIPNCIIFRPADLAVTPGRMYLVELTGIQSKAKASQTIRYVVEMAGK